MGACNSCGKSGPDVSDNIGYCVKCIRSRFRELWPQILQIHKTSRETYQLPPLPQYSRDGIRCTTCTQGCKIQENTFGFCGVRKVLNGKVVGGDPDDGIYEVSDLPFFEDYISILSHAQETSHMKTDQTTQNTAQHAHKMIAVFYHGCSFNCFYCPHPQVRAPVAHPQKNNAKDLAKLIDEDTRGMFFCSGGNTPYVFHALETAELAVKSRGGHNLRVFWETNGDVKERYMRRMAEISLQTGGCVILNFRAWSQPIHFSLCGLDNVETQKNLEILLEYHKQRTDPPFLIVNTPLVPGYIDDEEVKSLARFINFLDSEIPYTLSALKPSFYLNDLPITSKSHALRSIEVAESFGLKRVSIVNQELLSEAYEPEHLISI